MGAVETGLPRANVAATVSRRDGAGPFLIVCDHASNHMPAEFGGLGLEAADLLRHIAWDPGALGVASRMSVRLDAPLVHSLASRLLVDCNRPLDAPDLIAPFSESTPVPGNCNLTSAQRQERIARFYTPFHDLTEETLTPRLFRGQRPGLIAVHSFNPVYRGVDRPWEIGIIHDDDSQWALGMVAYLRKHTGLTVGINEPYSPKDRVFYTLERHARSRSLPAVMIEVRNNEIATEEQQARWGDLLSEAADAAFRELKETGAGNAPVHAKISKG
ncbi:MAG: N-formylglutamate amidohydrolase [Rhizobiaceae bacterium]